MNLLADVSNQQISQPGSQISQLALDIGGFFCILSPISLSCFEPICLPYVEFCCFYFVLTSFLFLFFGLLIWFIFFVFKATFLPELYLLLFFFFFESRHIYLLVSWCFLFFYFFVWIYK